MNMGRKVLALVVLAASTLTACGGDDGADRAATTTSPTEDESAGRATPAQVSVTARDYAFDLPTTFRGGLVEFSYNNAGKEPHFAAFAKIAPDKTFADVKAALTAPPPSETPPPGPPPFEEVIAFPTGDPGVTGKMTGNVPAGTYALYCSIPSPDGTPHAAKGMITEVTVTQGTEGELPASIGTVDAVDFRLTGAPPVKAGKNVVELSNKGKQIHEINLIELAPGRKVEDAVAWFSQGSGPPPFRFLAGAAVGPDADATTELDLKSGSNYAFVCAIPDFLGDFKPHVTKGMFTPAFTVP
jgi:hypothetical protein